eukprot:653798-Pyramimonas_sp.AAC.1
MKKPVVMPRGSVAKHMRRPSAAQPEGDVDELGGEPAAAADTRGEGPEAEAATQTPQPPAIIAAAAPTIKNKFCPQNSDSE